MIKRLLFKSEFSKSLQKSSKLVVNKPSIHLNKSNNNNRHDLSIQRKIKVKAGNGGDGIVSFMHIKGNEFAGPDGGDGGNGAHVIFEADESLKSLSKIRSIYQAENGIKGGSNKKKGKDGKHLVIKVPLGTLFKNQNFDLLHEMSDKNRIFIAAKGGSGGKGNFYYLSNVNKCPTESEKGQKGEHAYLKLELKYFADAALIGFENVGKTSLLNALTKGNTNISKYSSSRLMHFKIGTITCSDFSKISIIELPSLFLQDDYHRFNTNVLSYLLRCKIIIIVIDLSIQNSEKKQLIKIKEMIDSFDPKILSEKPVLIVGNKADKLLNDSNSSMEKFETEIFKLSALKKINIKKFESILKKIYDIKLK